jgi:hypothetical protein
VAPLIRAARTGRVAGIGTQFHGFVVEFDVSGDAVVELLDPVVCQRTLCVARRAAHCGLRELSSLMRAFSSQSSGRRRLRRAVG